MEKMNPTIVLGNLLKVISITQDHSSFASAIQDLELLMLCNSNMMMLFEEADWIPIFQRYAENGYRCYPY